MNEAHDRAERREKWVDGLMGRLTREQKVGQLMVFGCAGPFITPAVVELITKYHVGGLRISQKFHAGDAFERRGTRPEYVKRSTRPPDANSYDRPAGMRRVSCTPTEYARTLNRLRDYALDRKDGIGLHFTFDQEGEGADFLFGQRFFPLPMGLAASGDPSLAYRVARAIGKQARALGANMIHSPVLDVNTNPRNPEIGPRAYGDTPEEVSRYAVESLRGFSDMGIVATGKHFPGRGESEEDAHFGLPSVPLDRPTMMDVHIAPYRALIEAGLPAVMAAFTAYPGLGAHDVPAAKCPEIVTDILRGELGFDGVVTTDNIQMGGLLEKYEIGDAVIRSLNAGCDLILCRSETPVTTYLVEEVCRAVEDGRYSESCLDVSVQRILRMRWDMGLSENGGKVDAEAAGLPFDDEEVTATADDAARMSLALACNDGNTLPLSRETKVLLVEQVHHFHSFVNTMYAHPAMLWEEMRTFSDNVSAVVVEEKCTEADEEAVRRRMGEADVIVATSYYNYRSHAIMLPFLEELKRSGKPIVIVANTPFRAFGVPAGVAAALVTFCPSGRENIRAVAEALFGKFTPTARIPVSCS